MADAKLKYVISAQDNASGSIQGVQRNFQRLDDQVQKSRVQMNQFGGSLVGTQRNLRKFALGGVQQAGYQVGDFAVQVANGTSKVQAFGQQAGQFLQIFGPFGAVLGAAVSVISAVVLAKQKSGEAAERATGKIMDMKTALKNLTSAADESTAALKMMVLGITSLEEFTLREDLLVQQNKLLALQRQLAIAEEEGGSNNVRRARELRAEIKKQQGVIDTADKNIQNYIINNARFMIENIKRFATSRSDDFVRLREEQRILEEGRAAYRKYINMRTIAAQGAVKAEDILMAKTAAANQQFAALMMQSERVIQQAFTTNGRGSSQGGPSFDELVKNDPRVQLAVERMRLQDLEFKKAQEAAKKTKKMLKHELSPEIKRLISLSESIGKSFENAFMSAIDGTSSFKNAFKSMTREIISELYRVFVVKRITGFITNAFLGATVGPMQGPTLPGMSLEGGGYTGSGARAGGLDGKGGFMAMLHPNETVIDHTKGQGASVTVVQNINISTGVQQTVRNEIQSMMPQIAQSAKAAVVDAKRRGGSYGRAFA